MTIGIHLTAWRRPTITAIAFTSLQRICAELKEHEIDTFVVCGVSDKKSKGLAKKFGFIPFEYPNEPLGRKFDYTMREVLKYDCDYVMEYCSDNVMESRFVPLLVDVIKKGIPFWVMNSFYLMDWKTKEVRIFENSGFSNVGRLTRRYLLEKLYKKTGFAFEHNWGRRLDKCYNDLMWKHCKIQPSFTELKTPIILDLKSEYSLNGFQKFKEKSERFPAVPLRGKFPEIILDKTD